jgi:hypothetical protein
MNLADEFPGIVSVKEDGANEKEIIKDIFHYAAEARLCGNKTEIGYLHNIVSGFIEISEGLESKLAESENNRCDLIKTLAQRDQQLAELGEETGMLKWALERREELQNRTHSQLLGLVNSLPKKQTKKDLVNCIKEIRAILAI